MPAEPPVSGDGSGVETGVEDGSGVETGVGDGSGVPEV